MSKNNTWSLENGEIRNQCLHRNIEKRYKADTPFDNHIVPYLIMIFCASVDCCIFYSMLSRLSYDSPVMLGMQIGGLLFGFDVVPIFMGIQYRRLRQGLAKDRFVLILALIVCGLLVLDEIDKLHTDFGLLDGVNLGRQYGLQVILSTQSSESLYTIAPRLHAEHLTNAAISGFPVTVFFHPGDAATIALAQKLYGNVQRQRLIFPLSRYDKPSITINSEPAVADELFAALGIGDCFIKIRESAPVQVHIRKD